MSFDWERFKKGVICVHCKTEEEAEEFIELAHENHTNWNNRKGKNDGIYYYTFNKGIYFSSAKPLSLNNPFEKFVEWSDYQEPNEESMILPKDSNGDSIHVGDELMYITETVTRHVYGVSDKEVFFINHEADGFYPRPSKLFTLVKKKPKTSETQEKIDADLDRILELNSDAYACCWYFGYENKPGCEGCPAFVDEISCYKAAVRDIQRRQKEFSERNKNED